MLPKKPVVAWIMAGAALLIAAGLLFASSHSVLAPPEISALDEAEIYQAVIQAISQHGQQPGTVYVLRTTDDGAVLRSTSAPAARKLSPDLQSTLSAEFGGMVWLDSLDQAARDPKTGSLAGGGVVITLGSIAPRSGHAVTSASFFSGPLWGGAYTYTLDRTDAGWVITSVVQIWVS